MENLIVYDVAILIFLAISSCGSYFIGHRKGVSNTVDFLEKEGFISVE